MSTCVISERVCKALYIRATWLSHIKQRTSRFKKSKANQPWLHCTFLRAGFMLSRAWHRFHVFPRFVQSHVFPRFSLVTCFSALGKYFPRPWHRLQFFFPRLALVTPFSARSGYSFLLLALVTYLLPLFAQVTCFPALDTGYIFAVAFGTGYLFSWAGHWLRDFAACEFWFVATLLQPCCNGENFFANKAVLQS